MWKWVVRALAVLGALTVVAFAFAVLGFGLMATTQKTARLPRQIVLETQLHRGVVERADTGFLSGFGSKPQSVREIVLGLERAADDSRVVALVSDLSHLSAGLAQLQEIREAVLAFRKSGKRAIAFADTFGELTPADGAYYLASAYDEIHIQPSGGIGLTGLSVEAPFARGLFDKLGVTADFRQRHEYKSAPETFTRTDF
ncbi:MAG: S49 family peptidase, partial [Myxococcaceae bacterium]